MAGAGPAAVAAVGVTPGPDRGDLFLKLTSTHCLSSRYTSNGAIPEVASIWTLAAETWLKPKSTANFLTIKR
jgi:hypothetical protein